MRIITTVMMAVDLMVEIWVVVIWAEGFKLNNNRIGIWSKHYYCHRRVCAMVNVV